MSHDEHGVVTVAYSGNIVSRNICTFQLCSFDSTFLPHAMTHVFFGGVQGHRSRQMCDVILRFAEEGEEFHGKASGEKCILSGRAGVDHFMRFRKFSPENIFNATNAIQNNTTCTTAQTLPTA